MQVGRRRLPRQSRSPAPNGVGTIAPTDTASETDDLLQSGGVIDLTEGHELRESLVARARNRDVDAWEALYRLSYPGLRAYAARRVGPDLADDVVSEVMERAVASLDRYEAGRSFNAWLYGIARHVIGDMGRKRKRWERRPPDISQSAEQS